MSGSSAVYRAACLTAVLSGLMAVGCTGVKHAQPQESPPPATQAAAPVSESPAAATQATLPVTESPAAAAPVGPALVEEPKAGSTSTLPTEAEPAPPAARTDMPQPPTPPTKSQPPPAPQATPAKPPAAVVVSPPARPPSLPKPATAPVASRPPLDLTGLETRLRETRAIGVFTKIALKNQVDELLDKFRAYYRQQARTTLAELRRPYDMLLLKVLSLLQDSDPPLARDIVASREAIWGILADPVKFRESNLMAGETP